MDRSAFMQACREGGRKVESALRTLQRDYGGALRREGWLALRDEDSALDLVQETLIKVWRECTSFRGDSELFPWLRQILRRSAIDRLRRTRPEDTFDPLDPVVQGALESALRAHVGAPDNAPEAALAQQQFEQIYRRCAERFATEQPQAAEVIRWIAEDDLDIAEIAQLLQRTPAATREYVSQCRKKARRYFHDWYLLVAASPETASSEGRP